MNEFDRQHRIIDRILSDMNKCSIPGGTESFMRSQLDRLEAGMEHYQPSQKNTYLLSILYNLNIRRAAPVVFAFMVIIFTVGILFLNQKQDLAFADVLEQIRSFQTVTYKTAFDNGEKLRIVSETFYQEPGKYRLDMNDFYYVIDFSQEKQLMICISQKEAMIIQFTALPDLPNYVESLRQLQSGAENVLGREVIDGKLACGFQVQKGKEDYVIWADMKTSLPVRVEIENRTRENSKTVLYDFVYDSELDESLFDMSIPPGYQVKLLDTSALEYNIHGEKDLVNALRIVSNRSGGQLPKEINLQEMLKLYASKEEEGIYYFEEKREFEVKMEDTERLQIIMDEVGTIRRAVKFFDVNKHNDWQYQPEGKTLGGNEPLCWWKPFGSLYHFRVIYCDLTVADVLEDDFIQE